MSVIPSISIAQVEQEISDCLAYCKRFGWEISEIDKIQLKFTVRMVSPVDNEVFVLEVGFIDYNQLPLILDFIEPGTGTKGSLKACPKYEGDTFFHQNGLICSPCSRRAYKVFNDLNGPHTDWTMSGWQTNPQVGSLTSIPAILLAIHSRIVDKLNYKGPMEKR